MQLFDRIQAQISAVGLPLYAVTVTAVPRVDTPVLLIFHWHGFRRGSAHQPQHVAVPGSALQLNDRWRQLEVIDAAMLDAAWQLGAWDVEREQRRACNELGASDRDALQCRQAFGEHPLQPDGEPAMLEEAPDRQELMQLGAAVGYVRWQFRPVKGGLWWHAADDDTLDLDGGRQPPCPVMPLAPTRKVARTSYRLGRVARIILP